MTVVKNLGFIKSIYSQSTAPANQQVIWFDTNVNLHKYYNTTSSAWIGLAGGAQPWSTTLAANTHTGAHNPVIDSGQSINWENSGFTTILESETLTDVRTIQLPDKSGTIALISDILGASNLNAVLTAGNATGGVGITVTDGDKISGANLTINATTMLNMQHAGATKMTVNAAGVGFGTSTQDSQIHTSKLSAAIQTAAAFKISGGKDFTMGSNTNYAWMQSWTGHLAINPTGQAVSIGTTTTPAGVDPNAVLFLSGTSPSSIIRKSLSTNTSMLAFYTSSTKRQSIETDSSENFIIRNSSTNDDISFFVNDTSECFRVDGGQQMATMTKNYGALPTVMGNPGTTVSASQISCIDFQTTGASSHSVNGIQGGRNGKLLHIINTGSANVRLMHNASAFSDKILVSTASNVDIGPNESVTLIYITNAAAWFINQHN